MGKTGSRSMIFDHWGAQNVLTGGDRQTAGCEMVNTLTHGEGTGVEITFLDDGPGQLHGLAA